MSTTSHAEMTIGSTAWAAVQRTGDGGIFVWFGNPGIEIRLRVLDGLEDRVASMLEELARALRARDAVFVPPDDTAASDTAKGGSR